MSNYNLTNQQIKDSFQQLVQVSGSFEENYLVDGTGSAIPSLAVTASNATLAATASFICWLVKL